MTEDRRQERVERRLRLAAEARERVERLSRPSPLPPHPEGLRPRVWPVLAVAGAVLLSAWNLIVAFIAVGLVLAYAVFTRNERKNNLLWTYVQGRRQFMQGNYDAALANFQDMEEADFSPPAVVRAIGLTSYHLGHWADAASYLEDVEGRTADEDVALGQSLIELGEHEAGAKVLDGLAELPPIGEVIRAVAAYRLGHPDQAVTRLETVLAEAGGAGAPAEEPYLGARYWLGLSARAAGDRDRAREALLELSSLNADYLDTATVLKELGGGAAPKD